jgi:hypothetical protein
MVHLRAVEMRMVLQHLPMPPSSNALYRNATERDRARYSAFGKSCPPRFKTEAYDRYYQEMKIWCMQNQSALDRVRDSLVPLLGPHKVLRRDVELVFPTSAVLTKDGRPKKNDTFNRLKALDDLLAEALGVDDCYFWSGSVKKFHRSIDDYVGEFKGYCFVSFEMINIGGSHGG